MGPNTEPRHVYAALRRLQENGELELVLDTTANGRALHLKMKQDGIHLFRSKGKQGLACQGVLGDDAGRIIARLSDQFSAKEKVGVDKVESIYEIMHHVSMQQDNINELDNEIDADDDINEEKCAKKSHRLIVFQQMVQAYFSNASSAQDMSTTKAPEVIKNFPMNKARPMSCLSSDVSLLMQVLSLRRQEQIPIAVHINHPNFADYRDLCLAKILHSIDAPRAPILSWYSHQLWGKYRNYSFPSVVDAITKTFDNT
jgi:hypothetical protein